MSPVACYRSAKTDTGVEFVHGCRRKKGDTRDEDGRKEIASDMHVPLAEFLDLEKVSTPH